MITQRSIREHDREMPPTKIHLILKEFPWVSRHIQDSPATPIRRIYISAIELGFLDLTPATFRDGFGYFEYEAVEQIRLLDPDGEVIPYEMSQTRRKRFLNLPIGPKIEEKVEQSMVCCSHTIRDVLRAMPESRQDWIRFILSYNRVTEAIIIYKVPKTRTFPCHMKHLVEEEKERITKTCEAIDGE